MINGCFSIGKSTVAKALATIMPAACVIEPDLFANFHPTPLPEGFNGFDYIWTSITLVVGNALDQGLRCIVPVGVIQGVTSSTQSRVLPRLAALRAEVLYYHLTAPFDRVLRQNRQRPDVSYPGHIVKKCWERSNAQSASIGVAVNIAEMDNTTEVPALLAEMVERSAGLIAPSAMLSVATTEPGTAVT